MGAFWSGGMICLFSLIDMHIERVPFPKGSGTALAIALLAFVVMMLPRRRNRLDSFVLLTGKSGLLMILSGLLGVFFTFNLAIKLRRYPDHLQMLVWLSVALSPLILFVL
jgi:hypothetical protein